MIVDAFTRVYGRNTLFLAVPGITCSWAMRRSQIGFPGILPSIERDSDQFQSVPGGKSPVQDH